MRKLVALAGTPVSRRLSFAPTIQLNEPESKAFIAIRNRILTNIDHASVLARPFVLTELEDALVVSMLCNFSHNMRELLEQEVLDAGSWRVKRVEAHLDAPFDIERIAAVTGISARSIDRVFKSSRGYSPIAFVRQRRLQRARQMLEDREMNQTVTQWRLYAASTTWALQAGVLKGFWRGAVGGTREETALKGSGGAEGNRTLDLCIANASLSQLSYRPHERRDSTIVVRYDRASAAMNEGAVHAGNRVAGAGVYPSGPG